MFCLTSGYVEIDDLVFGQIVQVLDQGSKRVAVRGDDHLLAILRRRQRRKTYTSQWRRSSRGVEPYFQSRHDLVMPVGQETLDRVLEAFRLGHPRFVIILNERSQSRRAPFRRSKVVTYGIFGALGWQVGVVVAHWWRWDVIGSSPDLHLSLAMESGRLGLVQALQTAVHALVETPRLLYGYPVQIELFLHQKERLDGALEHAREGHVEREAGFFEPLSKLTEL